ncbi:MAG: hypothetical protein WBP85_11880 [Terracidiphilus sp.]
MNSAKHICLIAILGAALLRPLLAASASPWERPATALADQIAAILGPGQAHLTLVNLSGISDGELPAIRNLLTADLKARGIAAAGDESANSVRVTFSQNASRRLWVAEIAEGNQTQVAIVDAGPVTPQSVPAAPGVTLLSQRILTSREPILAALETPSGIVTLEPAEIVTFTHVLDGWQEQQRLNIHSSRALARDPRGALLGYASGLNFEAWIPGVECSGSEASAGPPAIWSIECRANDDPWAITQPPLELTNWGAATTAANTGVAPIRAFYNAARNYFTGVLAGSAGADLPPFYSAALIPRAAGNSALLVSGIDGRVQLAENGTVKVVAGARDWGSDFAVTHSNCGAGAQIVASSSGEAPTDSLRAYELPALEAVPVSAPLDLNGTVTVLSTAPDGKSVFAVVRNAQNQFEVDRVTALCN